VDRKRRTTTLAEASELAGGTWFWGVLGVVTGQPF
jgi:hypothetical protein